jgi:hypothetical protein
MWIGTDDKGCSHYQCESAISFGSDVTGSFHDKFEVVCGLEEMIEDDVVT